MRAVPPMSREEYEILIRLLGRVVDTHQPGTPIVDAAWDMTFLLDKEWGVHDPELNEKISERGIEKITEGVKRSCEKLKERME